MTNSLALTFLAIIWGMSPGDGVGVWKHTLTTDITASQITLHDWAKGGQESTSWALLAKGQNRLDEPRFTFDIKYRAGYGQAKVGDGNLRKNDDQMRLEAQMTRKFVNWFVHPTIGAALKTQFRPGYQYREVGRSQVSTFFDPAYMTYNAGAGREFGGGALRLRAGFAMRQTITRNFNSYADDRATPKVEKTSTDGGVQALGALKIPLHEHAKLTSEFKMFRKFGEARWILENDTTLRISMGWLTVTVNGELLEDPRSSDDVQFKTTTGVGIGYTFL